MGNTNSSSSDIQTHGGSDFDPPNLTNEIFFSQPTIPVFSSSYSSIYKGSYRGEAVAIKVLTVVSHSLEVMSRKVRRELEVWGRLNHPNIVPIYGYAEGKPSGPFCALVLAWYPNGDATAFFRKHGKDLTMEERKKLWQEVALGVSFLHHHDPLIIHGDLKPSNVLIDDEGSARLCDFGLARIVLEQGHSGLTITTAHLGTERYLAPELVQADDVSNPTTASDVYALGCIGLEFLYSQVPHESYQNPRPGIITKAIKDGNPPAVRPQILSKEDATLWSILGLCWHQVPSRRVQASWVYACLEDYVCLEDDETNNDDVEETYPMHMEDDRLHGAEE